MPLRLIALLISWLVLVPTMAAAQSSGQGLGPQRTDRIEAELVPLSAWAVPGSTVVVALRQVIQPGWHTYWRNPGDSGGPTTLTWSLPQGVKAGDIVWPLPQRQRLLGLTNYGYEGEVFLPVPIEIPASARPGTMLRLSVKALFLVCSDQMCVPDQMTLGLDLPIRAPAGNRSAPLAGTMGGRIQAVIQTAPRPAGIGARATLVGRTLTLTATSGPLDGVDIRQASFFPFEGDVIDHAAAQFGQRGPAGVTLELAAATGLTGNGLTRPISGLLVTDAGAWEVTAVPGAPLSGTTGGGSLTTTADAFGQAEAPAAAGWLSLLQAAAFALVGGLILNLMPCVFPVLAMKAAALTRSAHDPVHARRDGLAFTGGVLLTFAGLAAVLLVLRAGGQAIGWGFQLQSPAVVAGLALLMLAVALNLAGVFDVGGGLQKLGGSRLVRLPGGSGAFFTGVLAVVVAAPCTAPFMAFALGAALLMPAPAALVVFLMLGLGLALPYLIISLSPALLGRLPRPGPWMETLRRALSIPMFAAAIWLVWVFARQTGLGAWPWLVGACLVAGIAAGLLGPNGTALAAGLRRKGSWIRAAGWSVLALAFVLAWISVSDTPSGAVSERPLAADAWSQTRVDAALAQGRPVLVNFTADWCVSCKINERTALSSPRVERALTRTRTVYLKADWTRRDDLIARELARHGRSGVPLYLLYKPGLAEPLILPQLLTEGVVIDTLTSSGKP